MQAKKAHFIGIAGMGMSALAILLKEAGWRVSGSDAEVYPPATTQLERHGILFTTPYRAENIPRDADVILIGKNARLTRENNEESRAAYESGLRIASFPEILGELTENRETIVVAGSYGKSTTTTLVAWLLSHGGVDAGWFIGASPQNMEPAHLGTHSAFVLEGDEYPTSHEDERPKFAHYRARDCIITAATHDHMNVYATHEEFLAPFRTLLADLPERGIAVICADEPHAVSLAEYTKARVVTYGLSAGTWRAERILRGETTAFDLVKDGETIVHLSTNLVGDHNIQNIVGASAMLLEKTLLTPEQVASAIKDFTGLARRLDKKTTHSHVPAFEGFGSSREKLRAAINALRAQYPDRRLVVVFEPHTFSWRNRGALHWFDDAFEGAGLVVLYKPAEQGAGSHAQSSQDEMRGRLVAAGIPVKPATTPEETMDILRREINADDCVLLSSSGAMDGLIGEIPLWLDATFV